MTKLRVLFDTNILLDFFLQRNGFTEAEKLWRANARGEIRGYVTASSITDIFYFASDKGNDPRKGYYAVALCLLSLEICAVNRETIEQATVLHRDDFEDCVQIAAAHQSNLDAVLTRDIKGFKGGDITLYSPPQLIKHLKLR